MKTTVKIYPNEKLKMNGLKKKAIFAGQIYSPEESSRLE